MKEITENKEAIEKSKWLSERLEHSIRHAKKNKIKSKRKSAYIKGITILASGSITILLGLNIQGYQDSLRIIAFVLGAVVTMLNALEPFFNFRSLWIEYKLTEAKHHQVKEKLDFYLAGLDPQEIDKLEIEKLQSEYQETWETLKNSWIKKSKPKDSKSGGN